jgi:hypothetical protein
MVLAQKEGADGGGGSMRHADCSLFSGSGGRFPHPQCRPRAVYSGPADVDHQQAGVTSGCEDQGPASGAGWAPGASVGATSGPSTVFRDSHFSEKIETAVWTTYRELRDRRLWAGLGPRTRVPNFSFGGSCFQWATGIACMIGGFRAAPIWSLLEELKSFLCTDVFGIATRTVPWRVCPSPELNSGSLNLKLTGGVIEETDVRWFVRAGKC